MPNGQLDVFRESWLGGPNLDLLLKKVVFRGRCRKREFRSQESEARSQNRMKSLRSSLDYIFKLSRGRIPYSEFCLLNSGFLSGLFTEGPTNANQASKNREYK
jgi:hypothetical protein